MSISNIDGFKDVINISIEDRMTVLKKTHIVHKVNEVAESIMSIRGITQEDLAQINKFIEKVRLIDKSLGDNPLAKTIDQLTRTCTRAARPKAKEKDMDEESSKATKIQNPVTTRQDTNKVSAENFKKKLKSLDLNNPHIKEGIQELENEIPILVKNKLITKKEGLILKGALAELKDTSNYLDSPFEEKTLELMANKYGEDFKNAREEARPLFKNVKLEKKQSILKILKANDELKKSIQRYSDQQGLIKNTAIINRLNLVIDKTKNPEKFNDNVRKNYLELMQVVENAHFNIMIKFQESSKIFLESYEKKYRERYPDISEKKFQDVLTHYSFMNPEALMIAYVDRKVKESASNLLGLPTLSSDPAQFKIEATKYLIALTQKMEEGITPYLHANFDKHLSWLLDNVSNLKAIYNQGDDKDCNLSEGVCFANSLERYAILLRDPQTPADKIPLRGSAKGREIQAQLLFAYEETREMMKTDSSRALMIRENARTKAVTQMGLRLTSDPIMIVPDENNKDNVLNGLGIELQKRRDSQDGRVFCLLSLRGETEGHAIDIQIDKKLGIFRIIDDNLGIVEWSSIREFNAQFKTYLKITYPDLQRFTTLSFYELI